MQDNFLNFAFDEALNGKTKAGKALYRRLSSSVKGRLRNKDKIRSRVENMSVRERTEVISQFVASESSLINKYQKKNTFTEKDKFILKKIEEKLPSTVSSSRKKKLERIEEDIIKGTFVKDKPAFQANELTRSDIEEEEENGKKQIFKIDITKEAENIASRNFSKKGDKINKNPKDRQSFFQQWNKIRGYDVSVTLNFSEDDKSVLYTLVVRPTKDN